MKHLFLPLPIETVNKAWEDWRSNNQEPADDVRLLATQGGCFLVTSSVRPPRVFVDLLKDALARGHTPIAAA